MGHGRAWQTYIEISEKSLVVLRSGSLPMLASLVEHRTLHWLHLWQWSYTQGARLNFTVYAPKACVYRVTHTREMRTGVKPPRAGSKLYSLCTKSVRIVKFLQCQVLEMGMNNCGIVIFKSG